MVFNNFFSKKESDIIHINYLSHQRNNFQDYWKVTSFLLNGIKPENKLKIKLFILATQEYDWNIYMPNGIDYEIIYFNNDRDNYINKIKFATSKDNKYSVKLDEDCFFSCFVWDYIIENISILDDSENLLVAPLLSNNIPLVDLFLESFIKDELVKKKVYNLFLNQSMPNGLWGIDYSPLNSVTIGSEKWDIVDYYDSVKCLDTNKKGIHPIRLSAEAQVLLNNYILDNIDRLFSPHDFVMKVIDRPYFTTSTFIIKTSIWKKLLKIKAEDNFDEIQLNIYKNKYNKKLIYVSNGFGIHTVYNTIFGNKNQWNIGMENGEEYEIEFVRELSNKLGL